MKITIRRSVNAGTVFLNLIPAWDYAALPWYRKVTYTDMQVMAYGELVFG